MFGKFCKVLLAGSTPFVFWEFLFENVQVGLGWTIFRGNGWSSLMSHVRPKCLAGRAFWVRFVLPCRVVFVHSANTFWCLVWESNCECGLGSHILQTLLVYISNSRAGLGQVVWLPTPSGVHSANTFWWLVWGFDCGCALSSHTLYTLLAYISSDRAGLGQVVNFGSAISLPFLHLRVFILSERLGRKAGRL